MIVVGEPSGDAHAASLVKALRNETPDTNFQFFGATGPLMRDIGVETVVNSDSLAIMGIVEVAQVLPRFISAFRKLKASALENKPDAVVLVDWPEFNLRLASALHRRGLKVIYYISPQLWAWRPRRVKKIRRDVDLLLSILPFENEWYEARGVKHVEFVGHPLSGEVVAHVDRKQFCKRHELDPAKPIVAFLAGSRHKEVVRILPPMLDAMSLLVQQRPDLQMLLVIAPSRKTEEAINIIKQHGRAIEIERHLKVVHHETRDALAAADVAAIASGTATLEGALLGTPMVIVYKESPINWHTLGRLITSDYFGLVNLIAGEQVATELMQHDLNGENLAQELLKLLDPETNKAMRSKLKEVSERLGEGGASTRAAQAILRSLS
jgi:lipid-A-disaccharide synthase